MVITLGMLTPTVAVAVIDPSIVASPVAVTGLVIPTVAAPLAERVTTERVSAEATLDDPSAPILTFTALAADVYCAITPVDLVISSSSKVGLSPW
jgi:hypothetical protein